MYKKHVALILVLVLFISNKIYSQTTDVMIGFNNPLSIAFSGTNLYIVNADKIQKIDVSIPNPIAVTVVSGLTSPQYLAIKDNYLFVAQFGKISKVDITAPTPTTAIDVISVGEELPAGLLISGNDLYIAILNGGISKIDITQVNPAIIDVLVSTYTPFAMAMNGNDLYFCSTVSDNLPAQGISKIDVTQNLPATLIISGLDDPKSFIISGNRLIFTELGANKVSYINISVNNPIKTEIVEIPLGPYGIAIHNSILYISEVFAGKIVKLNTPLSVIDVNQNQSKVMLSPNPAHDEIEIYGAPSVGDFVIYNFIGQKVLNGTMVNNKIDIKNISNGAYFIKLENLETIKFIKK